MSRAEKNPALALLVAACALSSCWPEGACYEAVGCERPLDITPCGDASCGDAGPSEGYPLRGGDTLRIVRRVEQFTDLAVSLTGDAPGPITPTVKVNGRVVTASDTGRYAISGALDEVQISLPVSAAGDYVLRVRVVVGAAVTCTVCDE